MLGRFHENATRFASRGFWSLVDQSSFALANFAINVLLARWLGPASYGAFSIAFTIFLLVGVIFNGLVVEPMMVYGSGRFQERERSYLKELTRIHWKWCWSALALSIGVASLFHFESETGASLRALAIWSGPLFYLLLMRRACYVGFRPRLAGEGGLIYLVLVLASMTVLQRFGYLSVGGALFVMGACSLIAGAWIHWRMNLEKPQDGEAVFPRREITTSHWDYGRWAVATNILSWIPGNLYMLLLPLWGGTAATGEMRASFNLVMPVLQVLTAAGPVLLPVLVKSRDSGRFAGQIRTLGVVLVIPPLLWTGLLFVAGPALASFVYDGAFEVSRMTLIFLGFSTVFTALTLVLAAALRAMEAPKLVFRGYLGATLICLAAGVPMTLSHGVAGAAAGMLLSMVVNAVILWFTLGNRIAARMQSRASSSVS